MTQGSNKQLIQQALSISNSLTYNEDAQGAAKHLLRELAHRLDRARTINADQVAWMLAGIGRYLPPVAAPAVSRARDMQSYALLYELMEVAGLQFEDEVAAQNATPADVQRLHSKNRARATDVASAMNSSGQVGGGLAGVGRPA